MDKNNGGDNFWGFLKWMLLACCGFVILMFLLYLIDWWHTGINQLAANIFHRENYFSGEVWFSVIATCVAACPGIFCGVLALIQTRKLNRLEHRPSLGLQSASLEYARVRSEGFEIKKGKRELRGCIEKIRKAGRDYFALEIVLEIRNEAEVEDIVAEEMRFRIAGQDYCFELEKADTSTGPKQFSRQYKGGKYLCLVKRVLYPCSFKLKKSSRREADFWNQIVYAMNYEDYLEEDYAHLEIDLVTKVFYENALYKKEKLLIRTFWDVSRGGSCENTWVHYTTEKGYCKFCQS